jgi:hypothetical protein
MVKGVTEWYSEGFRGETVAFSLPFPQHPLNSGEEGSGKYS